MLMYTFLNFDFIGVIMITASVDGVAAISHSEAASIEN